MRTQSAALVALVLVLTACGGAAAKHAAHLDRAPKQTPKTLLRIRVTAVLQNATKHDLPPTGVSRGDEVVQRDVLFNGAAQFGKGAHERIGSDLATLTYTSGHTAKLRGVAKLPDGTIRFRGEVKLANRTFTIPVVGGTGRYAEASGALLVGAGTAKTAPNTYTLFITAGPIA